MTYHKELEYGSNIDRVVGLQFSLLSPEEILSMSVAEITTQETYEGDNPKIGGLFDPRMGVLDHGKICPTDGLDNRFCPGYFGHIQLAAPCLHIQFLNHITRTLKSVCWRCSKCLINIEAPEYKRVLSKKKGIHRSTYIQVETKNVKRCGEKNDDGCGALQPNNIKKDSGSIGRICAEWKVTSKDLDARDKKIIWNAEDVLKILKRISPEDSEAMGFNRYWCRPDWMVCTVLPVPPPSVRPSVRNDSNTRMEDDLTHKLCDIVKTNRILKQKIEGAAPKNVVDEWAQLLQYHIATLIDNAQPGVPPAQQRSGRPLKSIRERLRSKEGRVRGNLMGKRVDFSARSVITPDPNIDIDELGVPKKIAKNLTIPERVTQYNLKFLTGLVTKVNAYDEWPGAKSVKRVADGQIISLKHIDTVSLQLEIGDIVNRHLLDGDIVLFNRQPSLHRMSMMGHRVRVMDYSTFRLNVSVTTPYNADFDGDEMNMHVPQSVQSSVEIRDLALVTTQIISPAQNKPIISFVQDTLLGSYIFTQYSQYFTEEEFDDILVSTRLYDGLKPNPDLTKGTEFTKLPNWFPKDKYYYLFKEDKLICDLWSGRSIFSICLSPVNLQKPNSNYDDCIECEKHQNMVKIVEGKLVSGIMDNHILGGKDGGLIHTTFNDYGKQQTKYLLDGVQNIITKFMVQSSFSIGIGDLVARRNAMIEMETVIKDKKRRVIEIIEQVHNGVLENNSGKPLSDEFEIQVNKHLNQAVGEAGKIAITQLPSSNRMINIVKSGSKGSVINIGQMIALVGQQNVDGKRIPYGFTDRTLPHFHKYDDGPSARGFVENSFMKGLNPHEFFFHAMGGREGVIDTAVKTSETGYIQRKLIKAMEDLKIVSDLTVRNANGVIVQFLYGEDGIDPTKIEKQKTIISEMSLDDLRDNYYPINFSTQLDKLFNHKVVKTIRADLSSYEVLLEKNYTQLVNYRNYLIENIYKMKSDSTIYCPLNIQRICINARVIFPLETSQSDLDPKYVLSKLDHLERVCRVSPTNKANKLLTILIRSYLSPIYAICKMKLGRLAFDKVYNEIISSFQQAIDEPGTLVGIIAAQSIGEPATQMTLNTFHFAGVGSKSEVVRGVPRLKEIISVSKNMKSPMLSVYLRDEYATNKEQAVNILNNLEITTIKDITNVSKIYFDPSNAERRTTIPEDDGLLQIYQDFEEFGFHNYDKETEQVNPWLLRFEFDREKMVEKQIRMIDIYYAIYSKFNKDGRDDMVCVFSDDNASNLVFRIQCLITADDADACDEDDMICLLKTLEASILNDIVLKGIKGISKASMNKEEGYLTKVGNDYQKNHQWVIDTVGTNLIDVLNHPQVDFTRTFSNSIHEIYEVLGVEAAREAIISEITELLSFDGTYINYRHISLLADIMTNRGILMSIDRHGINKSDRGPLAKCSFEETPDIISKAAIFGEYDKINGVSSNIMLGQEVKAGTGFSDILFDEKFFLEKLEANELAEESDDEDAMLDVVTDAGGDYCANENFGFNFTDTHLAAEKADGNIPMVKLES